MAKAQITFQDIDLTVTVPVGSRVIEISEKVGAGIIYGCRECDCGDCLMRIVDGADNLSEPSVLEQKVLQDTMAGHGYRLACQAQVLGDVTIRPG
jgi:ferredoxin